MLYVQEWLSFGKYVVHKVVTVAPYIRGGIDDDIEISLVLSTLCQNRVESDLLYTELGIVGTTTKCEKCFDV